MLANGSIDALMSEYGFVKSSSSPSASCTSTGTTPKVYSSGIAPAPRWNRANKNKSTAQPAPEDQGWKLSSPKQKIATEKAADVLDGAGWSVPVFSKVGDLKSGVPGVALATPAEARQAVSELTSNTPMAILSTTNVEEKGAPVAAVVKDKNGKLLHMKRYLIQLGTPAVDFASTAPKGVSVTCAGTSKIVMTLAKDYCTEKDWSAALAAPKATAATWLKTEAGGELVDMGLPTQSETAGTLQVVCTISTKGSAAAIRNSGKHGFFVRPFVEHNGTNTQYKVVPLPNVSNLGAALRVAQSHVSSQGLVMTRKGLALRVNAEHFEEIVKVIHADNADKFLGSKWEVAGIPLEWCAEAVKVFLGEWKCEPVAQRRIGFRRTWIVSAASPPPERRLGHPSGEATISEAQPRARHQAEPTLRWAGNKPSGIQGVTPRVWPQKRPTPLAPTFSSGGTLVTGANWSAAAAGAAAATPGAGWAAAASGHASPTANPSAEASQLSVAVQAPSAPAAACASTQAQLEGIMAVMQTIAADVSKQTHDIHTLAQRVLSLECANEISDEDMVAPKTKKQRGDA